MADNSGPARLLVVEDNATTARTLRLFLQAQGYAVTSTETGAGALALASEQNFDLVLLDRMLPDVDGITVCRALRSSSSVSIVMLTARAGDDDVVAGLDAGADDYVCKPFGSSVLLARIRRCLRRGADGESASSVLRHDVIELDSELRSVKIDGRPVRLTRTEFAILHQLMRRPGQIFTRARLISAVMGPDFDGVDRTIDTHIWSLRKKLGERGREGRLIVAEPGIGYRLRAGEID